jgi:hypothetical protein
LQQYYRYCIRYRIANKYNILIFTLSLYSYDYMQIYIWINICVYSYIDIYNIFEIDFKVRSQIFIKHFVKSDTEKREFMIKIIIYYINYSSNRSHWGSIKSQLLGCFASPLICELIGPSVHFFSSLFHFCSSSKSVEQHLFVSELRSLTVNNWSFVCKQLRVKILCGLIAAKILLY